MKQSAVSEAAIEKCDSIYHLCFPFVMGYVDWEPVIEKSCMYSLNKKLMSKNSFMNI